MRAKTQKKSAVSNFPFRVPTVKLRMYQDMARSEGRSLTKQIEVVLDRYLVERKEARA